ncbi:MAG: glycosyltransferase family 2 protein [Bacteroidales bacterium]|nr:glycosyltransferase family 2 protein [Bacteroidales bacterium]
MDKITAVIITKNEERNIGRCIESLQDVADEVVVIDSGSTDNTEGICLKAGVRFEFHEWAGYSGQKNYANGLATHPWLLSIDADEALSEELRASLTQMKKEGLDPDTVYSVNRLNNYCGQWIRHCGWYPDARVRLWHKGAAEWDGLVHEELRYTRAMREKKIKGDLLHYSFYSFEDFARRQIHYASLAASKASKGGKKTSALGVWLRPGWTFFRNYIIKGGFLDGYNGYVICRMTAFYTFLKYAQLKEDNHLPASV